MPFTNNDENINRNGRPKILDSEKRRKVKDLLSAIYLNNLNHLQQHEKELTLKDRIEILRIVTGFILPKLNSVSVSNDEINPQNAFKEINVNIIK